MMTGIIKSCADPLMWVLLLLIGGLVWTRRARKQSAYRAGWWLTLCGILLLFLLSLWPVANLLTYSLLYPYEPVAPEDVGPLDIVVVLGGGMYGWEDPSRPVELSGRAYARWFNGVQIFKAGQTDLLAFCGGRPRQDSISEAEVMKRMAVAMGVPSGSILTEKESENTMQNAAMLAERLPSCEKRRIGLVTSAVHMRRSEHVFHRMFPHDTIVPVPVYEGFSRLIEAKSFIPCSGALDRSKWALHEWIGMVWYAVRY